uniref:mRNA-capping enzyme n=1 Tax=Mesocestoides corti TaxID=53468 RepID=A0A5K3EXW1_MESCO
MSHRRNYFLPPRWLKCPRVGSLLVDLFIPFKTPLDSKFADVIPPDDIFDPESLFDYVRPYRLGLVFDLTKSTRFYHRKEIENHGCTYLKIACKGNEECPTEEQVKLFTDVVRKFVADDKNVGKKIGVHCTHGFNRTGFLIVSYMVNECYYSLELALKLFADARPPGIYKADYLMELYKRFDDPADCIPAPDLPDWCLDGHDGSGTPNLLKHKHPDSPGENVTDATDESIVSVPSKSARLSEDVSRLPVPPPGQPKFMNGVTGVRILDQNAFEAHHVRAIVDYLIKLGGIQARREEEETATPSAIADDVCTEPINLALNFDPMLRFRGSQPVSMTRQNARLIVDQPYAVTYKSDGTRYLMLVHGPEKGYPCGKRPFESRLEYIEKYVVRPRNDAGHNQLVDFSKQTFSVRKKPFFRLDHVAELLQLRREALQHKTDGLVFQPAGPNDFYVLGTCNETLKWKPPELNTIDFRCKVYLHTAPGEVSRYVGELYLGGSPVPNAHLVHVTSKDKALDGKIVECQVDRALGGWRVLRIRTDKTDPNHLSVGKLIMESILFPVTADDVIVLVNMWRHACLREKEERMKREGTYRAPHTGAPSGDDVS